MPLWGSKPRLVLVPAARAGMLFSLVAQNKKITMEPEKQMLVAGFICGNLKHYGVHDAW